MIEGRDRWGRGLLAAAGLLGAAGVGVGAASAHLGGGDLARLASIFLLLHGAAIPGILAVPSLRHTYRLGIGSVMALGAALFSGDLSVLAFTGHTPVSGMAPAGGLMLIAAWLALFGLALFGGSAPPAAR